MATTRIPGRISAKASIRPPTNPDGKSNINVYVSAQWRPESGVLAGSQFYVLTQGAGVENFYVTDAVSSIESSSPYQAAVVRGSALWAGQRVDVEIRLHAGQGAVPGATLPLGSFAVQIVGGLTFGTQGFPQEQKPYSGQVQITGPK